MTYNPLDNDDLRRMIFSNLRVPCEYKKPSHYSVMKPYCVMVKHVDHYYLNPLELRLKYGSYVGEYGAAIKARLNRPVDTIGDCLFNFEHTMDFNYDDFLRVVGRTDDMFYDLGRHKDTPTTDCEFV